MPVFSIVENLFALKNPDGRGFLCSIFGKRSQSHLKIAQCFVVFRVFSYVPFHFSWEQEVRAALCAGLRAGVYDGCMISAMSSHIDGDGGKPWGTEIRDGLRGGC